MLTQIPHLWCDVEFFTFTAPRKTVVSVPSEFRLFPPSVRRHLEADVEVGGQHEVLQETLGLPRPGCPGHLPAVGQPLRGRRIRAGETLHT